MGGEVNETLGFAQGMIWEIGALLSLSLACSRDLDERVGTVGELGKLLRGLYGEITGDWRRELEQLESWVNCSGDYMGKLEEMDELGQLDELGEWLRGCPTY